MIKTEQEYKRCLEQLKHHESLLAAQRNELTSMNLTDEQVEKGLGPALLFQEKMRIEVAEYERLRTGDFDMSCNFDNIGRQLIAYRIYKGVSQAELAKRLEVSAPQVSRDERNEYSGASMEKIKQVLRALGMELLLVPNEWRKVPV